MNSTLERQSFAGFNYPKYSVFLPKGTPKQRLEKRKTQTYPQYETSPYFQSRPAINTDGRSFYLESDFAPGLRWTYCDKVANVRIDHSGWFTDEYGEGDKIRGIVLRLPHGKGFLAGWTMGENMISEVEYDVYDREIECAYAADTFAERVAEKEREHNQDLEDEDNDNEVAAN